MAKSAACFSLSVAIDLAHFISHHRASTASTRLCDSALTFRPSFMKIYFTCAKAPETGPLFVIGTAAHRSGNYLDGDLSASSLN